MRPQLFLQALALLLPCLSMCAAAQESAPPLDTPPPITVVYVEGRVDTVGANAVQPAHAPDLLDEDDRLVTGDGRAELAFADGALVHLDRATDTRVDLGVRLRLVRGRIIIHTPRDGGPLAVATPAGVVRMQPDGEYDLAASDLDGDTIISAIQGRAVLEDGDRDVPIAADDEARLDPRDRRPRWARAARPDEFRHWATTRVWATTRAARTWDLPAPLAPYAPQLAEHGQWTSLPPYGQIWMPSTASGWRPYTNGEWRFTRYGWTWIDTDAWAWPVHHFGRWGHHDRHGWFWIPQRTWGPAWVGWAIAADHVAWSPLGWDARPVVDFFAGARVGPVNTWADSWSILPRRDFGMRSPVFHHLEDPRGLPGPVLGGFVSQLVGPRGPAGAYDRFTPRAGRGTRPSPATGRDRDWRSAPQRDLPESFGSAAPARPVGAPADVGSGAGPRREGRGRPGRPGDPRPIDGASPPGAQAPMEPGPLPDGRMRPPNSIRPRYDPPTPGSTAPNAPPPSAPVMVAPPPRGDGLNRDGARAPRGGAVQRRDDPRGGEPAEGGSDRRGAGAARPGDAAPRGEGQPAPRTAPAQRPGQPADGTGSSNRRRPR